MYGDLEDFEKNQSKFGLAEIFRSHQMPAKASICLRFLANREHVSYS